MYWTAVLQLLYMQHKNSLAKDGQITSIQYIYKKGNLKIWSFKRFENDRGMDDMMSNETDNTTVKLMENVIILEVENILEGWLAYVITFMPEDTQPHKIILHLKNPSKYITVDSDDSDDDTGARHTEYNSISDHGTEKLTTISDVRIMVTSKQNDGPSLQYESEEQSSDDGNDESSSGEDENSSSQKTPPTTVCAIPVTLSGIPKDMIPAKRKTFDLNWPPWFMTWLEAVKPAEDAGGNLECSAGALAQ
ncbi:hypothetical protein F5141DRAFT_1062844 [Pisolithus sp. B1]|nr:hypothetical protein F5141DRAFT_1062844 [Pisolithus sp. B1]